SEKATKISVLVPDDKPATRPEMRNVAKWITDFDLSPSAKRVALAARGDIFTVPAEHGDPRNLTNSPASRERNPAWSPDGTGVAWSPDSRWLAYTRPSESFHAQIRLYSLAAGHATTFSDDMSDDLSPAFDPKGRWLYFISRRTFEPSYGQFELDFHFTGTDK